MEFIDGEPLSALLRTRDAAGTARRRDRRHVALPSPTPTARVVPPRREAGNVLITSDGQVKVTDFGIARAVTPKRAHADWRRDGTATYFSPKAEGVGVGTQSDIYSLGVVSSRWWRAGALSRRTHRCGGVEHVRTSRRS